MLPLHLPFVDYVTERRLGQPPLSDRDVAEQVAEVLTASLDVVLVSRGGSSVVTVFAPEEMALLTGGLSEELRAVGADVAVGEELITMAWGQFMLFLQQTERWTGTPEEWHTCMDVLTGRMSAGMPGGGPAGVVAEAAATVEPEVEASGLATTFTTRGLDVLLDLIGTGRPVTQTGALRLADVRTAVERLGRPVPEVRTMRDLLWLHLLWEVAQRMQVLEVRGQRAVPGNLAAAWAAGSLTMRRQVVQFAVDATFRIPAERWGRESPAGSLLPALTMGGLTGGPVDRNALDDLAARGGVHGREVLPGFRLLQDLEVFDEATGRVPQFLRPALAELFSPPPVLVSGGLEVDVELVDSFPRVWRRLRFPSSFVLADLHVLIQIAFEWQDSHLHSFAREEPYRADVVYEPAPIDPSSPKEVVDEATVHVGELLRKVGDQAHYLYDFGDDWLHRITLREVFDVPSVELACPAGEGRSPMDDSGGVHGWAHLVAAAGDPTAPDHDDAREWFDLPAGEAIDPTEFDASRVDSRLRRLAVSTP